eukprot:80008_1
MGKGGCVNTSANAHTSKVHAKTMLTSREISMDLLAKKKSIDECWIAYEGGVYDVTHWLSKHPGGVRAIMSAAGSDASSVMKSLHAPQTLENMMTRIRKVGTLVLDHESELSKEACNKRSDHSTSSDAVDAKRRKKIDAIRRSQVIHKDFEALGQKLFDFGWYEHKPSDYAMAILRCALFLYVGVNTVLWSQTSSLFRDNAFLRYSTLMFGSVSCGIFFQNIAFMGHDAGHASVTGKVQYDNFFGLFVGNAFAGIDVGWWKSSHYVHHSATNSLHDDPDIQHMPLLCLDERMSEGRWSTYHSRYMPFDAIARAVIPYQHWYFYPVLAVARINLYLQSFIYLAKTCPLPGPRKAGEKILDKVTGKIKEKYAWPKPTLMFWTLSVLGLVFFWTMMYSFLSQLELIPGIICFSVMHFTAGILHVQIMVSHLAMHYCADGHGTTDAITAPNGNDEAGYYEWQALSTMDVDCPKWMDWFHGGLQFQLEHHLFPRVPRWRLRELCALTDEIFAKYEIPVLRIPFVESNRMMLNQLADVGAKVAKEKAM